MQLLLTRTLTIAGMAAVVALLSALFQIEVTPKKDLQTIEYMGTQKPLISSATSAQRLFENWNGQIDFLVSFDALNPADIVTENEAATVKFDPSDSYFGLPEGAGADLVLTACSGCHSLRIIMQQRQTKDGWAYLLNWMEEKQGMAPLAAEDESVLIDYLTANFGATVHN